MERDGRRIAYEVHGDGEPTILFLPSWSIVNSQVWKAQVPYVARHFRAVTFDGRAGGRSSRPTGVEAYTHDEFAADAVAVLDATTTERAVLVALSAGGLWGTQLAAERPDLVLGLVAICPAVPLAPWLEPDRRSWERHYGDFLAFFFDSMFTEAHSTKPIEDGIGWGLEVDPPTLIDTYCGLTMADADRFRALCGGVACPVLVIHGDDDAIRLHASGAEAELAALTGGRLVTIAGGGHGPSVRDPVFVNLLIREFVQSLPMSAR